MAEYHSQALVLPVPGPTPKSDTQITTTLVNLVNLPAIFPTGYTPQPELLDDDDFVLVEKSSPLLRTTPETLIPVTSIPQTGNANAALPNGPSRIGLFKCPGCHRHFYPFSSFVIHIDGGECSSASMSQRINNEINAFAVQLFRNLSVTSGWTPTFRSGGSTIVLMNIYYGSEHCGFRFPCSSWIASVDCRLSSPCSLCLVWKKSAFWVSSPRFLQEGT